MAISVNINKSSNRIYLSVTDNFHFPDFFGAWRNTLQHPDYHPSQSMVWDLSQMNASSLLESDLERIAEFMQGQARVTGYTTQVALIAPTKATYGLASSYLNFLLEDQGNFSLFRSLASGEGWLQSRRNEKEATE